MLQYKLFESECGSSHYAVLLHGFGGNHRIWKYQIPLLQKKFNVVAIDLPSHGDNELKASQMKATIDSICREIVKVLDSLDIRKAVFLGISLGTVFIRYMEQFYKSYVEKAVLVGAVGKVNLLLRMTVSVFAKIGDKLPFYLVYKIFAKLLMPWKVSKKSREVFCECAKALNRKEFRAYMYIFKENFSFIKRFVENVHKENLYITGRGDLCFIKGVKEEVQATQAEYIEMDNCGHVCNIDQKQTFNNILKDVLKINCRKGDLNENGQDNSSKVLRGRNQKAAC